MTSEIQPSFAEAIKHEHDELEGALHRLRLALADRSETPAVMRSLFHNLATELETHFAHEERGGYFSEVLAAAPRLQNQIELLERQHRPLLVMIKQVRDSIDGRLGATWWEDTAAHFEDFVHHFIEHEVDENSLLQEAYCQDIGSDD
ncbi:MAG: hemerythrin domain-containing protein [Pirellulaceae bacterium]|jgi:iron-sulfur cluster repair protein YtfE (RIC family)|nr:hemerythrin domain-containing protein [Pirellulaceae bacterium]